METNNNFTPQASNQPQGTYAQQMQTPSQQLQSQITLGQTELQILHPMMKKLHFISVVGIIFLSLAAVLLVIGMISSIIALSSYHSSYYDYDYSLRVGAGEIVIMVLTLIFYVVLFVIALVALVKLCSGSSKIKRSIEWANNGTLTEGLKNIHSAITIYYVLTIVGIVLFVIGLLATIIISLN